MRKHLSIQVSVNASDDPCRISNIVGVKAISNGRPNRSGFIIEKLQMVMKIQNYYQRELNLLISVVDG